MTQFAMTSLSYAAAFLRRPAYDQVSVYIVIICVLIHCDRRPSTITITIDSYHVSSFSLQQIISSSLLIYFSTQMNSAFTTSITDLKADAAPYTPPPPKGGVDQLGPRSSVSPNSVAKSNLYHRADTQYCVVIDPQIPPKPLQQRSRPYNKRTDTTFQSIDTATPRRRSSTSRSSSRSSSTPSPQKNKNKNYKTEPCSNLSKFGHCKYGDKCHFYHHEGERRERVGDKSIPCLLVTISGMW